MRGGGGVPEVSRRVAAIKKETKKADFGLQELSQGPKDNIIKVYRLGRMR